ncbi:hypothetical protein [Candidatus Frankia alpina]|uniref:hypothetical protein n=1 Tax=Candidatus Frankia alpina TaxID=2699483 RepID=UPI001F1C3871|nr:hypothetical protein [Candidatus Frankia alpina]
MPYAAASRRRAGRPTPTAAGGPPAPGDVHRPARLTARRRGRYFRGSRPARATLAAAGATVALTGLLAVADAGVARAGGVVWASCPSGQVSEVSVPAHRPTRASPRSGSSTRAARVVRRSSQCRALPAPRPAAVSTGRR